MIGRASIRRVPAAIAFLKNPRPKSQPQNRQYGVFQRRLAELERSFSKQWETFDRQQKTASAASLQALLRLIRLALGEVGESRGSNNVPAAPLRGATRRFP